LRAALGVRQILGILAQHLAFLRATPVLLLELLVDLIGLIQQSGLAHVAGQILTQPERVAANAGIVRRLHGRDGLPDRGDGVGVVLPACVKVRQRLPCARLGLRIRRLFGQLLVDGGGFFMLPLLLVELRQ